ncbi:MAG: N-methylhydantoinase [Pseudobdellovibrio sp.]|jgi:hypothetical protein|nr:N-methylhydantoinase [Pseudobdellovibrio sp.]
MNGLQLKNQFELLTKFFKSCSVVNADGTLLYSKDQGRHSLTTTRLVAFQIVKKYLQPQPLDFFVLNDPENGGFQLTKQIFIAALQPNLFLVWDEDFEAIDFKIPPTPLFDKGVRNEFVWKALVENRPYSPALEVFINQQKAKADALLKMPQFLDSVSANKNQQDWLKVSQEVFNVLFNTKAQSSGEAHFKMAPTQMIKLKLTVEEKQNVKMFVLDMTNTNLATDFHAASHVFESAAVKKIIDFYGFAEFFNQSILDKIKMILPPRSIVSKPHAEGLHNISIQAIASQLCEHLLAQFNNPSRKSHTSFQYSNFLSFKVQSGNSYYNNLITKQCATIDCVEALANSHKIEVKTMRRLENRSHIQFEVKCQEELTLTVDNKYDIESSDIKLKVNGKPQVRGCHKLVKSDLVEISWEF